MNLTTKTTAPIRTASEERLSPHPPGHRAWAQPCAALGPVLTMTGEEYVRLLHPEERKGSVTIGQKIRVAKHEAPIWTQRAVRIEDLPGTAASLAGVSDAYVTPNSFWGERLTERLVQICAAYSDLDYYKIARWRDHDPKTVMLSALDTIEAEAIPLPSLVLFSGRGLLLLWLHSPLPKRALGRWNALQKRLFSVLTPFGADPSARDVARVFRIIGSVHGETGETVKLLWALPGIEGLPRWPFDTLFERAMPLSRQELIEQRAQRAAEKKWRPRQSAAGAEVVALEGRRAEIGAAGKGPAPATRLTGSTYWGTVLTDLHRLRHYRYPNGLLPRGQRNAWMFFAGIALSWTASPEAIESELISLARRVAGWSEGEIRACISSVCRRAEQTARAKGAAVKGEKPDDLRYKSRAETIVERLEITGAEMRGADLRVLITPRIKQEHARERQQAHRLRNGADPRSTYLEKVRTEADDTAEAILGLLAELGTAKAVAEQLGISVNTAKQRLRRARRSRSAGVRGPSRWMVA